MQRLDGVPGGVADLVLEADGAEDLVVADDRQDRGAAVAHGLHLPADGVGDREVALAEEDGAADGDASAVDVGLDAPAGHGPERRSPGHVHPAVAGGGDDGAGERVLAVGLDGGGEGEEPVGVAIDRGDVGESVLAPGEGAGLVEQDDVDGAHLLERSPVLDEDP